jgi:hypothetical protein
MIANNVNNANPVHSTVTPSLYTASCCYCCGCHNESSEHEFCKKTHVWLRYGPLVSPLVANGNTTPRAVLVGTWLAPPIQACAHDQPLR